MTPSAITLILTLTVTLSLALTLLFIHWSLQSTEVCALPHLAQLTLTYTLKTAKTYLHTTKMQHVYKTAVTVTSFRCKHFWQHWSAIILPVLFA